MKNIRKFFHLLSYLQYPLVTIAFSLLIKPLFKGLDYLTSHPEYLFNTYSNALIFLGITLSFSALQDPARTSLGFEKKIWQSPKRSRIMLFTTLATSLIFFVSGMLGFIVSENFKKEFAYGSIVLAIGLLGYLKFQLDIFDIHKKGREERESAGKRD